MTYQQLKKKSEGFTIIEVLIVLAIAGLIMLIVFLAVPALQRNQRNNARNSDASRVAAAITECLANRNGQTGECDASGDLQIGTLSRLDPPAGVTAADLDGGYSQTTAAYFFGHQCDAAGRLAVAGGGSRAFAVVYQLEPNVDRCISS